MTKKELELILNKYKMRVKYSMLVEAEVQSAIKKLLILTKDSDTKESISVNKIVGDLLYNRNSIHHEYKNHTGDFSIT